MKNLLLYLTFILFPILTFAQISGDKIIGSNQPAPYNSLTNAVAHVNTVGVSGPTRFLLDDANYTTPIGQPITIKNFPGSSAENTLTIKPNTGKTVTITANSEFSYAGVPAVLKLDGADNIIIDGSNTAGGTSRDLLLNNADYVNYTFRAVIWIASNGSNGANNIKILNTQLKMEVRSQGGLLAGIFSGNNTVGDNNSILNQAAMAANSNLTLTNNEFFNVRQAIVINSNEAEALKSSNIQITNNKIGSTVEVEKPLIAFDIINIKNFDILDNTIDGMGRATTGGDGYLTGIRINTSSNFTIKRNIIKNLTFKSNSITGYGIHIIGSTINAVISENKITSIKNLDNAFIRGLDLEVTATSTGIVIANNFISDISSGQTGAYNESIYGIYILEGSGTKIYHNTVALNAPDLGLNAAIRFKGGSAYDVRNNIFLNTSKVGSTNGTGPYAIYSDIAPTAFATINNNNYYSPVIGYIAGEPSFQWPDNTPQGVRTTLFNWQAAIGYGTGNAEKDQNSENVNPIFISTTDLHLQSVAGNGPLDNKGTPLSEITTDIDGQIRSTTTPDMGADEFSATPITIPSIPATSLTPSSFSPTGVTLNWTNGNGTNRLVVAHAATAVNTVPADGTSYTANSIFGNGSQIGTANYVVYSGTGSSVSISGLSACTSYKLVVYEFNGTGTNTKYLSTNPATSTVGESTTFATGLWTKGKPNYFTEAIISSDFTLTESLIACKLTVTGTSQVIVPATFDVTLNGSLTVESGASFTMASNTNLIQNTNVQNSGIITIQRESAKLFRLDYTMWGSPVTGTQTLKQFSPQTVDSRFYIYNSTTDVFSTIAPVTTFTSGKGYLIRMSNNHIAFGEGAAQSWTGTFTGIPNNGDISVDLEYGLNGYNMLSNPYASMIDAKKFLSGNSGAIDGTLYFWRRRNALPDGSAYYATYTFAGGTSVPSTTTSDSGSETPNGFIQVGQGFIVKKKTDATTSMVTFDNTMRTATNQDNQIFKNSSVESNGRVWLNVTNAAGEFGQTLIAYLPEADNDLDFTDGKYMGDGSTALTSWLENAEYIIQGRAPFTTSDVVILNFKTLKTGTYTIAIDHVDGLFEGNQDIFLRDNMVGVTHDLKESAYTFTTVPGNFNNRFEMVYTKGTLVVDNPAMNANNVSLYKKENNVIINSGKATLDQVEVFDMNGRLIALAKKINSNQVTINVGQTNQVLVVKITSTDGTVISKKTIN